MIGTIYRNRWQAFKVRVLLWGFVAFAIAGVATGAALLPEFGAGLAIFLAAIAVAPITGMLIYASIYTLEIRNAGTHIEIDVITLGGTKTIRIPVDSIRISEVHRGRMISARVQYIDTPWVNLWAAGRRLPFIIDLQAEDIDGEALAQLGSS